MKTSFVSSLSLQNSLRSTVMKAQNEMARLQTELSTGVHADLGAELGANTARSLNLSRDIDRIKSNISNNAIATQRLEASQAALESTANAADKIAALLINKETKEPLLTVITDDIRGQFSTAVGFANTSVNGEFLFSGINTDVKPFKDDGIKTAFTTALDDFMAAQTPPVSSKGDLTAEQMDSFLTDFEAQILDTSATGIWATTISSASDTNMTSRISQTETVETSTNANSEGMRKLVFASIVASELLVTDVNEEARKVVVSKASDSIWKAVDGLNKQRSNLGLSEARVSSANDALEAQRTIIETHLGTMQGVDTYEAKTRLDLLRSQIEIAYSLTTKLQSMSLVNYL